MAKAEEKVTAKVKAEAPTFTKEQLCSSVKYSKHKDILSSQLKTGVMYTAKAVDEIIKEFLKGKVK